MKILSGCNFNRGPGGHSLPRAEEFFLKTHTISIKGKTVLKLWWYGRLILYILRLLSPKYISPWKKVSGIAADSTHDKKN